LHLYGGASGLRDAGLLESALLAPQNNYLYEEPDIFDLAADYCAHLAWNHPFVDGNKRTAFGTALSFLIVNGIAFPDAANSRETAISPRRWESLIVETIQRQISKQELAEYFWLNFSWGFVYNLLLKSKETSTQKLRQLAFSPDASRAEVKAYCADFFQTEVTVGMIDECQRLNIRADRVHYFLTMITKGITGRIEPEFRRIFGMIDP